MPAHRRSSRIRTPIRSTARLPTERRPRLARLGHGHGLRRPRRRRRPTPDRMTPTTHRRMTSRSDRASLRRPTSTSSASSAATARRRSPSRPSTGRSTTTWTSSTCRSAPPSGAPTILPRSHRRTRRPRASSVVTSAGNSGPSPYITGSPGTGAGSIATAAIDSHRDPAGRLLDLTPGDTIDAIVGEWHRP